MNSSEDAVRAWARRGAMVCLLTEIAKVPRRLLLTWNKRIVDPPSQNVESWQLTFG